MSDQTVMRAEYVDYGVRIPRGDVTVVLLDAVPVPADMKRALDRIGELFGAPAGTEREP